MGTLNSEGNDMMVHTVLQSLIDECSDTGVLDVPRFAQAVSRECAKFCVDYSGLFKNERLVSDDFTEKNRLSTAECVLLAAANGITKIFKG
jgi:hypothetical protein